MNQKQPSRNDSVPRKHGPWEIHQRNSVYQDSFVELVLDQVTRPDGQRGQHVVVSMKAGVCVLPMDDRGRLILTSEFHYGIGRWSIEGVSGGMEPNEQPRVTAERELAEELGLRAQRFEYLTTVDPFTTIVVSPTQLFLATGLSQCPRNQEGTETIEPVWLELNEAVEQIGQGKITHAPTCVGILMLASRRLAVPA